MSFWEDASPVVKIALVVGVLAIVYLAVAFFVGIFPFASNSCTHTVDGAEQDGCEAGSECVEGECVVTQRGFTTP